jgi:hypothetical protein
MFGLKSLGVALLSLAVAVRSVVGQAGNSANVFSLFDEAHL